MTISTHSLFAFCRRRDGRVDYYQAHVLSTILYWADSQKSNRISTSYRALSDELCIAPDTVRNAVRRLEAHGFVRREIMPQAKINGITCYNNLNIIINYAALEAAVTGVPLSEPPTPTADSTTPGTPETEPSPTVQDGQGGMGVRHPHKNTHRLYTLYNCARKSHNHKTPPALTDADIERLCAGYDADIVSSTIARAATYRNCYTYAVVALWCSEAQARRRAWQDKHHQYTSTHRYPARRSVAAWAPAEQRTYDYAALEAELLAN